MTMMEVATDITAEQIRARLNDNHFKAGTGKPTYFAILDTLTGARIVQAVDLEFLERYVEKIPHIKRWIFTMHTAQ